MTIGYYQILLSFIIFLCAVVRKRQERSDSILVPGKQVEWTSKAYATWQHQRYSKKWLGVALTDLGYDWGLHSSQGERSIRSIIILFQFEKFKYHMNTIFSNLFIFVIPLLAEAGCQSLDSTFFSVELF